MDRRSTVSGSSSLSSYSRDEFKEMTTFFRNYFAGRKGESQDAAMEKSNTFTKVIKALGFQHQQLINWVKQKESVSGGDDKFTPGELWKKISAYKKTHPELVNLSSSELARTTVVYVREKHIAVRQVESIDVVDLEEESDQDLASDDFHNYFARVLGQRIQQINPGLNANATNAVIENIRGIVVDKVGFQPVSLLALYGCDLERMKKTKDPRKPPPQSRIRDILDLYFNNVTVTALLPSTCSLHMLLDTLVSYCEQSRFKDRFTSDDARQKYKDAYSKLPQQRVASPAYAPVSPFSCQFFENLYLFEISRKIHSDFLCSLF